MTGIDSVGFVHRLTQIISIDIGLNIRTMQLESSGGVVELVITVYVQNAQQLKDLIASLRKIKEIRKVSRLDRLGENETIN